MRRLTPRRAVALAAVLLSLAPAPAGWAQTVRRGSAETFVIQLLSGEVSPPTAAVRRGTTVVWENVTDEWVTVNLLHAAPLGHARATPKGFRPDGSAAIAPGATASLRFEAPGIYHFTTFPQGTSALGRSPASGTIIVQNE